jgi:hypothetical protein
MIIEPFGKPRADEQNQSVAPDSVINSLGELLDIFPPRDLTKLRISNMGEKLW